MLVKGHNALAIQALNWSEFASARESDLDIARVGSWR
jgi:hypothetical protein